MDTAMVTERMTAKKLLAGNFVDSLIVPTQTRFDSMNKAEIKMDRLRSKGLM